jgi:hypothetical protein
MYLQKNSEKKWLIKSENKILGPYSFDQILDLLRKKQISIIDEVRDPETRWLYVRENHEFKNIVEEIRKEIDSKQEGTKTYQSSGNFTGVTTASFEDNVQKTKTDIVFDQEEDTQTRDAEVVKETFSAPPVENIPQIKVEKAKLYGVLNDENVQEQIGNYSKRLKIITAALVLALASAVGGYFYYQHRNVTRQEEELATQIKRLSDVGLYDQAAEKFMMLPPPVRKSLLPSVLELFPALQKSGAANLEELKEIKDLSQEQEAYVYLAAFWSEAKQQNFSEAEKALQKAKEKKPSFLLIKENEAWLTFKKGQFMQAFDQFKFLFDHEKNGRYLFGMVLSYFSAPAGSRGDVGKDLLTNLDRYTLTYFDLKKELLLGQIYLAKELNEETIYSITLRQFFSTPPQLTSNFSHPSLAMPDTYNWVNLGPIIDGVKASLSGDQSVLFELHNILETGRLNAAADFVRVAQSKVGDPQLRAQLNLLLLNAQGRTNEVLALEKSNTLPKSNLNMFLLGMNQIKLDPKRSIAVYLNSVEPFYKEWLQLEQLLAKGPSPELKSFLQDHFVTADNFNPVLEARTMVEQ